jgi:hypothetical protein
MLAVFCLRLAAGMLACLLVLPARLVNPRYFRTHFHTALGLTGLAWLFPGPVHSWAGLPLQLLFAASLLLAFAGSFVYALEEAPGGKVLTGLTTLALVATLGLAEIGRLERFANGPPAPADCGLVAALLASSLTSAAVLGAALSAMLMGHIYLIVPGMSLRPLQRLLAVLGVALLLRMGVEGYAAWLWWRWTTRFPSVKLGNDTLLFLPVRWGVGFVLPLALGWMAWQTTRIRSTQSATGILYVVVIFCFLGELTSLLLTESGITLARVLSS